MTINYDVHGEEFVRYRLRLEGTGLFLGSYDYKLKTLKPFDVYLRMNENFHFTKDDVCKALEIFKDSGMNFIVEKEVKTVKIVVDTSF
ncbi:hypothetical protein [Bacillus phage Sarmo]|nr:hypothetical protein [Bacillus phage Sarmo]